MKNIRFDAKRCSKERTSNGAQLAGMGHNEQVILAGKLFMGQDASNSQIMLRELEKKRYSYYQQDLRKKRVENISDILTKDDLQEKLVASKLRCFYCAKPIYIFYKESRDPKQWSLDRIDNTRPHTVDNICISCLGCNLKRREISHSGYAFTKNLSIRKLE